LTRATSPPETSERHGTSFSSFAGEPGEPGDEIGSGFAEALGTPYKEIPRDLSMRALVLPMIPREGGGPVGRWAGPDPLFHGNGRADAMRDVEPGILIATQDG
jgi:hypothetical protein